MPSDNGRAAISAFRIHTKKFGIIYVYGAEFVLVMFASHLVAQWYACGCRGSCGDHELDYSICKLFPPNCRSELIFLVVDF